MLAKWILSPLIKSILCLILFQPKRPKKEKKELPKEKKQEVKEADVHDQPPSPVKEDSSGASKEDGKPQVSYALADMDKATFDAVC